MPRIPRTLAAVALVGAALPLLAGCATASEPAAAENTASAESAEPTLVRVALTTGTSSIAIADQEGFFADHGIDIEITELATGTETIAAVQGGSADIAYADTFAGVNAIHNGFDVKLVAGANHTSPAVNYLVRADSDIQSPADLAGAKLGIGGVPFFRVFANNFLEANDVDPAAVEFTIVKQGQSLPEALENGSIDAIQSLGYQVAYLNDGVGEGYDFRTIGDPDTSAYQNPDAVQAGWWTSQSWADANADTAHAFADAYREFAVWFNALDTEARTDLALEFNDIDYAALAGDDEEKLENLAFFTVARYVDAPVDVAATQEWIDSGARIAPDQVPSGVEIADSLLPSAE